MHSYDELERVYHEALSTARTLPRIEPGEDAVIASTLKALPAARILYNAYLQGGHRALLVEPTEASLGVISYRETGEILIYQADSRSLRVVNLAEAAGLLGLHVTVIGPEVHPAVRERLEYSGADIVEVGGPAPLLSMAAYSLYIAPRLLGAREQRYREELGHLDSALEWVREKLGGSLQALQAAFRLQPYYTPLTYSGALYQCLAARCGIPAPLEALQVVGRGSYSGGLVYVTGVEEHDYKDILLSIGLHAHGRLHKILIDTDPVTAGFYSILAALLTVGTPL